jgi:hypothetical protein
MSGDLPAPARLFTLEEAHRVLPRVRDLLESALVAHAAFTKVQEDLVRLEAGRTRENTLQLARPLREKREELGERYHDLQTLIAEIHAVGCVVKGLDPALIDFPSLMEGRVVFLCWRLGEPEIAYWHETTGNYYSRRPLTGSGK